MDFDSRNTNYSVVRKVRRNEIYFRLKKWIENKFSFQKLENELKKELGMGSFFLFAFGHRDSGCRLIFWYMFLHFWFIGLQFCSIGSADRTHPPMFLFYP